MSTTDDELRRAARNLVDAIDAASQYGIDRHDPEGVALRNDMWRAAERVRTILTSAEPWVLSRSIRRRWWSAAERRREGP